MLYLSRAPGESVRIGDRIRIQFLEVRGKIARVGLEAPRELDITRDDDLVQGYPDDRELASLLATAVVATGAATEIQVRHAIAHALVEIRQAALDPIPTGPGYDGDDQPRPPRRRDRENRP